MEAVLYAKLMERRIQANSNFFIKKSYLANKWMSFSYSN